MNKPLLTKDEEIILANRAKIGDVDAREELIVRNERLVFKLANSYVGKLDFDELVQEGQIGLMTAVEKFDPEKGFRFSTYATHWIKQAMTRAIDNLGDLIRVPIHKKKEVRHFAVSLNAPLPGTRPEDGLTYETMLAEEQTTDLEDEYWQSQRAAKLRDIMNNRLTKRERQVLILRFGLDSSGFKSLADVGEELSMTREGVRKAEKRAISKIDKEKLKELI